MVVTSHMTLKTAITETSVYLQVLYRHSSKFPVAAHVVSVRYPFESYESAVMSAVNVACRH
jgi:hypothetical protein